MVRAARHLGECGWFWAWSTVGALAVLGLLGLSVLALIPAGALGYAIDEGGHPPDRTAFGMVAGAGLLCVLVAYSNRNGPFNPYSWGAVGALLLAFGLVGFAVAKHRAQATGNRPA